MNTNLSLRTRKRLITPFTPGTFPCYTHGWLCSTQRGLSFRSRAAKLGYAPPLEIDGFEGPSFRVHNEMHSAACELYLNVKLKKRIAINMLGGTCMCESSYSSWRVCVCLPMPA